MSQGTFQEFPKALYKNGAYTAVADPLEEASARVDGWLDFGDDLSRSELPALELTAPLIDPIPLPDVSKIVHPLRPSQNHIHRRGA